MAADTCISRNRKDPFGMEQLLSMDLQMDTIALYKMFIAAHAISGNHGFPVNSKTEYMNAVIKHFPVEPLGPILIAEDDFDDRELTREAFAELNVPNPLAFFEDGAQLLDYLNRLSTGKSPMSALPAMILLDLNMPRMDGKSALRKIRAHETLRTLPVAVLSTSCSPVDQASSYQAGADVFICKPANFSDLVAELRALRKFYGQAGAHQAQY